MLLAMVDCRRWSELCHTSSNKCSGCVVFHTHNSANGSGALLCKRWTTAHPLSNHLLDKAIELAVALVTMPCQCVNRNKSLQTRNTSTSFPAMQYPNAVVKMRY